MLRLKTRRPALLFLLLIVLCGDLPLSAQVSTGANRPAREPGYYGVDIHGGALVPNRRKWFLPQNLYHEYQWRGWEYSNYARDRYRRYVDITLQGDRHYDPFGNYIARGWSIYEWTESNPQRLGSGIFKSPRYSQFFGNLVVSASSRGQFHTALTVGNSIRTTMTPLTFSKPQFNGIQWDFLSDRWAVTLLSSRLSSPGTTLLSQTSNPTLVESFTRLQGARGAVQLGDFAQFGTTWINVANSRSDLDILDNSRKGVLTVPQRTGNVGQVTIRISDDSPESSESGALVFFDQVIIDGVEQPSIVPLIRGGIREGGAIEARGEDVIQLIYDIRAGYIPTEEAPTSGDIRELTFELVLANDYRVEVASNMQRDRLGDQVFLLVAQAEDEIVDGSNHQFLRFDYGLPTAHEVMGVDLEIFNLGGLDLRAEYVVNRRYRRFPNQNFTKLAAKKATADAAYLTASYSHYPWFAYGEAFTMDPDYSTTAFISNPSGLVDYDDQERHLFEFVTDNDDQDASPDWRRQGNRSQDTTVFPGLDENNDFVSDYNQNQNDRPDYVEPFLRYTIDPPEFLFGMDMNNNTFIDRFEDDRAPDYPYDRDRRGVNVYGGLSVTEDLQVTLGRLKESQLSSARKSRATYGLVTGIWDLSGVDLSFYQHLKWVKDNISDNRLLWVDPTGIVDFSDPLDHQDTFVNSTYLHAKYDGFRDVNVHTKVKYEWFKQRGDQDDLKRNRRFFGLINKADYTRALGRGIIFWPKWKSKFRTEKPSDRDRRTQRDLEETIFLVTRLPLLPGLYLDLGGEFSRFENLRKRPEQLPVGYVDDFTSRIWSFLLSNTSDYLGYQMTLNSGAQWERQKFKDKTEERFFAYIKVFAGTAD